MNKFDITTASIVEEVSKILDVKCIVHDNEVVVYLAVPVYFTMTPDRLPDNDSVSKLISKTQPLLQRW